MLPVELSLPLPDSTSAAVSPEEQKRLSKHPHRTPRWMSYNRVSPVDSTFDCDKLKLFRMDDNIKPIKYRLTRRWHLILPMTLSLIAISTAIGSLVGAVIYISHLTKQLEIKSASESSSRMSAALITEGIPTTAHSSKGIPYNIDAMTESDEKSLKGEIRSLWKEVTMLRNVLSTIEPTALQERHNKTRATHGSTYVHWGKDTCQGDAALVYSGFGAGSPTTQERLSGGGVNYLCLPFDPEWNKFDLTNDTLSYGWIYAAEYVSGDTNIFKGDLEGTNVVCSVCLSPRSAKLMIPAKRTCPDTWTKEYEGYLMSSYIINERTTFECVDEMPVGVNGTEKIQGGALFYHVAGYCEGNGNLRHCPPYIHARELTCVVCTR